MNDKFREVGRLDGMKCFPGDKAEFVSDVVISVAKYLSTKVLKYILKYF